MALRFRLGGPRDVEALVGLVDSAYRGDASRAGWTTEADLLDGPRTDTEAVSAIIGARCSVMLVAEADGHLAGCCQLERHPGGEVYFGMFAVRRPSLRSGGISACPGCMGPEDRGVGHARDLPYLDARDLRRHRAARLATAIAAARSAGVPIIYVTVAFRPGYPEVSEHNKTFSAIAGTGRFTDGDAGMRVPPAIAPAPGEVTVTKRRVSAFSGSDLEVVLRARGISHLVLAGIATSGVVLSTLRQAADLDYRLTVLTDGCLDADPDVHQILLGRVFPRQAEVTTIAGWAARLHAAPPSTDDH